MGEIASPELLKINPVIPATAGFRIIKNHSRKDSLDMAADPSGFADKTAYTLVHSISALNNDRRASVGSPFGYLFNVHGIMEQDKSSVFKADTQKICCRSGKNH